MIEITEELYTASIPKCCEFQTLQEHKDNLMLCWGLTASIEKGKSMNCTNCDLNTLGPRRGQ